MKYREYYQMLRARGYGRLKAHWQALQLCLGDWVEK